MPCEPIALEQGAGFIWPLVALAPAEPPSGARQDESPHWLNASSVAFETDSLQHALKRTQQMSPGAGGLRRTVSAPQSLDSLGAVDDDDDVAATGSSTPSGGPLRRASSSLLRRSSFSWTSSAHVDFERAVASLNLRELEASPMAVLRLMRHHAGLKLADVEKHLVKRRLNRLMQNHGAQHGQQEEAPLQPPRAITLSSGSPRDSPYSSPLSSRSSSGRLLVPMMPAVAEESTFVSAALEFGGGMPQISSI